MKSDHFTHDPTPSARLPCGTAGGCCLELPSLPYPKDALEPYVSSRTLDFHYGKHHQAYAENLNKMVSGTAFAELPLEELICRTVTMPDKAAIFNNAAQVWNHSFYWSSMRPDGGGQPSGPLLQLIAKSFGSVESFKNGFMTAAVGQFGSGGVWLVQEDDTVKIIKTANAETPVAYGHKPLLTCDVWEHAYYLDYQNRRKDFVQNFLDHLVNWDFAASQLTGCVTL